VHIGEFTFSHCGSSPSSTVPGFPGDFAFWLIPLNSSLNYNAIQMTKDTSGLSLVVGNTPPPVQLAQIAALSRTPNGQYDLMFPQQFFGDFGLLVPAPFSNEPFFFQDDQRVYLVTESFASTSAQVSNAALESPAYARTTLNSVGQSIYTRTVFPPASTMLLPIMSPATTALARPSQAVMRADAGASATAGASYPGEPSTTVSQIAFSTFFHPFACTFLKAVNRYGVSGLLNLGTQALTNDNGVIGGFVLGASALNSFSPKLSPGILVAQGQIYEATTAPDPGPVPTRWRPDLLPVLQSATKILLQFKRTKFAGQVG
jgi:hypothetical protein